MYRQVYTDCERKWPACHAASSAVRRSITASTCQGNGIRSSATDARCIGPDVSWSFMAALHTWQQCSAWRRSADGLLYAVKPATQRAAWLHGTWASDSCGGAAPAATSASAERQLASAPASTRGSPATQRVTCSSAIAHEATNVLLAVPTDVDLLRLAMSPIAFGRPMGYACHAHRSRLR